MANPHKGEVGFEAGGANYVLSFSANAVCEAEEHFGRDPGQVLAEVIGPKAPPGGLQTLRRLFWIGLGDHHPEIDFDGAKALLKHLTPSLMAEFVGRAFAFAMPEAKEADGNPPKPGNPVDGIGPASSTDGSTPA